MLVLTPALTMTRSSGSSCATDRSQATSAARSRRSRTLVSTRAPRAAHSSATAASRSVSRPCRTSVRPGSA
ncbi:MAG: hypothetical protein AW07_04519 [Candidatus Accumulibacter sp. SK-11]|nr:MAG: hypothetical protein AW07_04519 [Candidatus Accumulibacter sp. SK-11]